MRTPLFQTACPAGARQAPLARHPRRVLLEKKRRWIASAECERAGPRVARVAFVPLEINRCRRGYDGCFSVIKDEIQGDVSLPITVVVKAPQLGVEVDVQTAAFLNLPSKLIDIQF